VSGTLYLALASVTGMGCLYSCCYRSRLRGQYGLKEKPCADCCLHWFCEPCALCQEYRELKNRGFDMAIGAASFLPPSVSAHPEWPRLRAARRRCADYFLKGKRGKSFAPFIN
jgi:hypothetical protein